MASVLVKNLPSASAINGTDLVIVNIGEGEEYVTSNMSIAEFKSALNGSITGDNTFASDVKVSGNVQIIKEESKFIGDLTGTADSVASLYPLTTADLPSDGFNLYFTAADATKLADLRTELNQVKLDVGTVTGTSLQTQVTTLSTMIGVGTVDSAGNPGDVTSVVAELRADLGVRPTGASAFSLLTQTNTILTSNTSRIDALESSTNTGDIASNTGDIATNTADIATNTADILTNASNITAEATTARAAEQANATAISDEAETARLAEATNEADILLRAPIESPTFTGTVGGVTQAMVGLAAVDNTADSDKPVSTAQQTAIDAVADIANANTAGAAAGATALQLTGVTLTDATDDSVAATAGIPVGGLYRNGSIVMIRVV